MRLYESGARVSQAQYGHGTVTRSDVNHTRIDFDDHGLRTFSTLRAQLEPSNTPAPVKPVPVRRSRAKKAVATA